MLGAIAGDVIGSVYENIGTKRTDFKLFHLLSTYTDDTVLTVAVAHAILESEGYGVAIKRFARRHPLRGFGPSFLKWMALPSMEPYNSFGNGSAMRVSPVGWAFDTIEETLEEAKKTAECTHNHPEGIKGAQAVALAIWLARRNSERGTPNAESRHEIKRELEERFGYDLRRTLDEIRPGYTFDMTCQGSVPESIIAFLESDSYEDAIRKAISLGGDADTMAAIAGGIAEAFYGGVPGAIAEPVKKKLPKDFLAIVERFQERYVRQG